MRDAGKRNITHLVIALATCIVVLAGFVPAQSSAMPPRLDAELAARAIRPANELVPVIVRAYEDTSAVRDLVQALGGELGVDLDFIQAFAAQIPESALVRLGRDARVRYVSFDHPILPQNDDLPQSNSDPECFPSQPDPSKVVNTYNFTIGANLAWAEGYTGKGITVAVVDSGVHPHLDLLRSLIFGHSVLPGKPAWVDQYGHGTHVAGIIAGEGIASLGKYVGIAPGATILPVRVCDDRGASSESALVAGLQWIYENRARQKIRVVNVSLNSNSLLSYHESPLDAALEILWFNGIVVVVSAGNNREAVYPPANDPFIIAVGAVDERGTRSTADDIVAPFSGYGTTPSGFSKPDLVAPGVDIVSTLPAIGARLSLEHPDHRVGARYFRLSGTSMAAAVTSGAVALLLQAHPELNPDEVKMRLMASATPLNQTGAGAGILNVYNAIHIQGIGMANTGTQASQLLWTGSDPVAWGSVNWGSVNWGSVNWGSVNWGSVNWGSVNWGSVDCSSVNWGKKPRPAAPRSVNWGRMPRRSVNWGRVEFQ
jgi:serine protease AprX